VGVVGVRDHPVGEILLAVFSANRKRPLPAGDFGDGLIGDELDAQLLAEFDDAVDDRPHPAVGVVDAHVEINVAHQIVERGRVGRRATQKDEVYCMICWSLGCSK